MPERHSKEIMMERSKMQYGDEPRQSSPAGLIIRQKEPTNLEMPFDQVDSYLTPTELFYIRSHFQAPRIDLADYQLKINGAVRDPLALSYRDLREMPSETRTATLECAGNGRVFLVPQVRGAQWELGAVGNAEWTGVPLRALLERAGLEDDAREVVLEGADRGTPTEEPIPPSPISYARSVPARRQFSRKC
jgi:DMSO/TMAO reductase YedYZ molybdopterin-dependent catalytic subunit